MPNDAIHAPWSESTVIVLNQQQHGIRHAYTCPLPNHPVGSAPALLATRGGWICSHAPECDYRQDWAHLVDVRFVEELRESLDTPVEPDQDKPVLMQALDLSTDDLARTAYSTYSTTAGGKAVNGDPLPVWDDVSVHVRTCWLAAVRSVRSKLDEAPRMVPVPITLPGD